MDWSQDDTLRFIELFQREEIIWNPKHKLHKNNQKINDAWSRISDEMHRPVVDLKAKKNSLMATFRKHLRMKKQSMKSGAGADDIYQTIWPYYEIMEVFLASVYLCDKTANTEEGLITSPPAPPEEDEEISQENNREQNNNDQNHDEIRLQNKPVNDKNKFKPPTSQERKRLHREEDIHKNISNTVSNLNNIIMNRKETDECDIYAQLLATRLREYSKQERRSIMHQIDGFLLANPPQQTLSRYTPSPTSSSSSNSTIYIHPPYSHHSQKSYIQHPQQSPIQNSASDRPSSQNSYMQHSQQSPILISIPDSSSFYPRNTSTQSTTVGPHITVHSQEVIHPSNSHHQNIIDEAYYTALYEERTTPK